MMALWSVLPQFTMTKLIIAVDADINAARLGGRDVGGGDPLGPLARPAGARPTRRSTISTSPRRKAGLGGKLGIDATNKIGTETEREYGQVLGMSSDVEAVVDAIWPKLGLK